MRIFAITIPRAAERREQLGAACPDVEFVQGVDWRDLAASWQGLEFVGLPQAAIAASHALLWRHVLTTTTEPMWIELEDDSCPRPGYRETIADAVRERDDWDVLKLWSLPPAYPITQVSPRLWKPDTTLGTLALAMKRRTAEGLLRNFSAQPVDVMLAPLRQYIVRPHPFYPAGAPSLYPHLELARTAFWTSALLPLSAWQPLIELLAWRHVLLIHPLGNCGDKLIHAATLRLFRRIGCTITVHDMRSGTLPDVRGYEFVCWGGGGNFGTGYRNAFQSRQEIFARAKAAGVPTVVLPCTVYGEGEASPDHLFVRERMSLALYPDATLLPDLAMSYGDPLPDVAPVHDSGLFIRRHEEASHLDLISQSVCDPGELPDHETYLRLAGQYQRITTDRLHFAIAGLLMRRNVTLLPNSYGKNRAVWEAWLQSLDCAWSGDP